MQQQTETALEENIKKNIQLFTWHFFPVAFCPGHFVRWHFVQWHFVRTPSGVRLYFCHVGGLYPHG